MLVIDDLTVRIAGRTLLEGASARIPTGARVGLVGRNGTGKTTLFGVIAGDISAEQGHVDIPPRWRIGRLAQEAPGRAGQPDRGRADGAIASAPRCWPKPRPRTTRIASPRSRPGSPISARTRRLPARHRSSPASASPPPTSSGPARNSPAAGACAWRSPRCCSPSPTCCCSTSRPTISTSKARSGCRTIWRAIRRTLIVISHDRDLLDTAVGSHPVARGAQAHALSRRLFGVRAPARASACCSTRR